MGQYGSRASPEGTFLEEVVSPMHAEVVGSVFMRIFCVCVCHTPLLIKIISFVGACSCLGRLDRRAILSCRVRGVSTVAMLEL